ncbi:MAG: DUF1501 domain-containing protein [Planctomycetota bacterium]|nr:DUF1501 domain-containing protein [Planctomycetota bacterium]
MSNRRAFLAQFGAGFGGLALATFLANEGARAETEPPLTLKPPHFAPRAKRVIVLFMFGGPSHLDTFDYKPALERDDGRPLPDELKPRVISFPQKMGGLMRSPFAFQRHGESGTWVSELFPQTARLVDELCVIRSMHCSNPRHGGAVLEWHTGSDAFIRPSMGSWLTWGLGSENQNLPGYITLCQSTSQGGANNYGSAFLPAAYQGTALGAGGKATDAKFPHIGSGSDRLRRQRRELELLQQLGRGQLERDGADDELEARLASFELAFRMQMAAPEAEEIGQETAATRALYGLDDPATADFGLQCLLARRYSERGVRFVQCNSNGWDAHTKLKEGHTNMARSVDRPIAGLLADLAQRGLLDETLVIWGGEFGRTPTTESADGRDHNPYGFSMWLAGGGVKRGFNYGQTDEYGLYAVENKVHFHDLHATILHLLGLDHKRLTYRYAGRDFRLTDVDGEEVEGMLA